MKIVKKEKNILNSTDAAVVSTAKIDSGFVGKAMMIVFFIAILIGVAGAITPIELKAQATSYPPAVLCDLDPNDPCQQNVPWYGMPGNGGPTAEPWVMYAVFEHPTTKCTLQIKVTYYERIRCGIYEMQILGMEYDLAYNPGQPCSNPPLTTENMLDLLELTKQAIFYHKNFGGANVGDGLTAIGPLYSGITYHYRSFTNSCWKTDSTYGVAPCEGPCCIMEYEYVIPPLPVGLIQLVATKINTIEPTSTCQYPCNHSCDSFSYVSKYLWTKSVPLENDLTRNHYTVNEKNNALIFSVFHNGSPSRIKILITDIEGREIETINKKINLSYNSFQSNVLDKGVYLYYILIDDIQVHTGKSIIAE